MKGLNIVGVSRPVDGTEPTLKRGHYIFDPKNARWYRITDYEERPAPAFISTDDALFWASYDYRVTLETAAIADAGRFPTPASAVIYSGAILLPGVVDVYPMGSLSLPAAF
jgi:hypothetical protein